MLLGGPALFFPLTSEPRRTQTGEPAHSVHTGGSVPAGLWNALIHINLTVSALEPRHTEARVSVPADSAYRTVLARVWRAQVHCWRQAVRSCTYEQITFSNTNITEYHWSWYLGCTVFTILSLRLRTLLNLHQQVKFLKKLHDCYKRNSVQTTPLMTLFTAELLYNTLHQWSRHAFDCFLVWSCLSWSFFYLCLALIKTLFSSCQYKDLQFNGLSRRHSWLPW